MTKHSLVLLGWLALTIGVGGCTQKIAKVDSPAPADNQPPTETAAAPAATQNAPAAPAAEVVAAADAPAQGAGTPPAPKASAAAAPSAPPQDAAAAPAAQAAVTAKADQNAAAKPEQGTAKTASSLPLPPQEVADAIKKLTHSPRARYLSRTAQYDYYVGGRFDAKYGLNDNQLIVTSDGGGDQVKCEYSNDGKMVSDGKSPPKLIGACNTLINELGDFLSR